MDFVTLGRLLLKFIAVARVKKYLNVARGLEKYLSIS